MVTNKIHRMKKNIERKNALKSCIIVCTNLFTIFWQICGGQKSHLHICVFVPPAIDGIGLKYKILVFLDRAIKERSISSIISFYHSWFSIHQHLINRWLALLADKSQDRQNDSYTGNASSKIR